MRNKLVYSGIFLANFNYILFNTVDPVDLYKNGIRILVIGLLILSTLLSRKILTLKRIDLIWMFLLSISLFSFNVSMNLFNFLYIILVLISSEEIKTQEFFKKSLIFILIGSIFIFALLFLGITENIEYVVGGRIRNTFGFVNVNAFSNVIYAFAILFFLYIEKIKLKHYIFVIGLVYFFYTYTDTRASTYAVFVYMVILVGLNFLYKFKATERYMPILKGLVLLILSIPVILSFLSSVLLNHFPVVDVLTSMRLSVFSWYIANNNIINLFFGGSTVRDVDNGFLVMVYSVGIGFGLLALYMINRATLILIDQKKSKYIAFIISFIYFNIFESMIIRPELIITICFWVLIYKTYPLKKTAKSIREG